ncbi:VOC family protein [Paenibacillus spongiae]|uniref:VOC family protein n=1 Tax=Paenibacillus spongiae TaxID=2909671 RepID=A0ABY5SBZ0_9BACL|nr:VOC family protein [Paenibacillus spongiae]UVI31471.1 VOC family protein [Paenibacillus spongiae]
MTSPIRNEVGGVFIPVKDVERAREWYCRLLGIPADCEIMFGHLCPLQMQGVGLILDTMPMWGGDRPGGAPHISTPVCMLLTNDLDASYAYAQEQGMELVSAIEHNHWFVLKDPDGNLIMICRE